MIPQAISTQQRRSACGKLRRYSTYVCSDCGTMFETRSDSIGRWKSQQPLCTHCARRKRPFESIYNGLFNDRRGIRVDLTYEEYLQFTAQEQCFYCGVKIPWAPYSWEDGSFISRAYYLDRKDHDLPYSRSNCVVCCTQCNRMRSNKFTHLEFIEVGRTLSEIYQQRHRKES